MTEIEFHGAARTVTGSNFIVRTGRGTFAVDCGMFQGPDVEGRNLMDYDYNPKDIDFTLLTHSHIDHSGMLPKLVKKGFKGKIYATGHTVQITSLLLLDSAKIQENNFQSGRSYGKYTDKIALAYHSKDAEDTINKLSSVNFDEEFSPMPGITVKYIRAGHILGAASIEVTIEENGEKKMILFSGDIGRLKQSLIPGYDLDYRSNPDYILIESLYGGIEHPDRNISAQKLMDIVTKTLDRGGNAYIPTFSVHRTQEILHELKLAKQSGVLPADQPVWLDSPLAQKVSNIYMEALQHSPESQFDFPGLRYVRKYKQSQKLHNKSRQIILAGSGMADGGRIVDHLANGLGNKKNTVCFVGYQAEGTLGRALVEGSKDVEIGDTKIQVRAQVEYLHGFSAHGDNSDYLDWMKRHTSDKLKKVFLIHAEEDRAEGLDKALDSIGVTDAMTHIPDWREKVVLD